MSLVTSLYNKVQYLASNQLSDPNADAYARQQAEQAKQDAEAKKREEVAAAEKAKADAKKEEADAAAAELSARSKFDSRKLITDTANGILTGLGSVILICFCLYGGHLAANQAIGYNAPFRVLSFLYGAIVFFYVIPRSLYKVYGKGETLPYYSFLPLSTYVPNGNLEGIVLGLFCYQENDETIAARKVVEELYAAAYNKSKTAAT